MLFSEIPEYSFWSERKFPFLHSTWPQFASVFCGEAALLRIKGQSGLGYEIAPCPSLSFAAQ